MTVAEANSVVAEANKEASREDVVVKLGGIYQI